MNLQKLRGKGLLSAFPLFFLVACSSAPEKYAPKTDTVTIAQMKFQPAELTVHAGDTVVWVNKDMVPHDVTQVPTGAWTSTALAPGQSWKIAVTESDNYYCSIHIVMTGKLIVQKP